MSWMGQRRALSNSLPLRGEGWGGGTHTRSICPVAQPRGEHRGNDAYAQNLPRLGCRQALRAGEAGWPHRALSNSLPLRVPFDFPPGTLPLTAHTYTEGGAFLEIMQIDLPVHAPAYLAAVPSQLTNMVGDHQTNLVSSATAHLLLEDQTQGPETVTYRTVSPTGEPSDPIITTDTLSELPGMQRYALSCDICNRATVVTVNTPDASWEQDLPVIRVIEGR